MNIIIIDDEKDILSLLVNQLERLKHTVCICNNIKDFREAYIKDQYDLVMTDISMPDQDGRELCRELRKGNEKLKLLIITGTLFLEDEEREVRSICDGIINKPWSFKDLKNTINTLGE